MLKRGRVNLKNILLVFMIIQPFLDSYVLYSDQVINFFGFSPTTILRFSLLGLIFIILFFKHLTKKENKYLLIYGVILVIYTLLHHLVCINIDDSVLYTSLRYNLIKELFYLLRLVYPIILSYIVYLLKISKKDFKNTIQASTIVLSLILFLMNLFLIAKTSYFNNYIKGNIFDWFTSNTSRYLLASKGWFNSANQIGGQLLLLVPINFYYATSSLKIKDILIFLFLILSCYMIGTRISCVGISLVLIILGICFYAFKFFKKEQIKPKEISVTIIITLFSLLIFNFAPIVNLSGSNLLSLLHLNKVIKDNSSEEIVILTPEYDGVNVCEFLKLTSTNEAYYKNLYPCNDNLDFWTNYVENGYYKYINNRLMEDLITKDIYKKITSPKVNLFGMSRSRFENAEIYLERDILVHYYTIGIFGIIVFILPYFMICGWIGIKKLLTKSLKFWDLCLISSILLPIVVSALTGHIIDELIVTLYIGFNLGYLLYTNYNKEITKVMTEDKNDKRKKILFVVDENRMGGVSVTLKDMVNLLNHQKYKIDILVLHNSGEQLKDLGKNIQIIYGTKFFEAIDYNLKDLIKQKKLLLIIKKLYIIFLMKTCLIKYKILEERKKILTIDYDVEIAFKDGFTAVFTAYGTSKKKIHWLHYEYKKYNANGNYPKLFYSVLPIYDKIVAVSSRVMNDFNEIYHLENKTITIGNLVDTKRIIKLSKEKCNRVLNKDKLNIICVGRLHECKGYDRLIKAVDKLSIKEKKKINIKIYGDGLEKEKLKKMVSEYKLDNTISLEGKVDNPYKYIKGNDLFILCSYFETFGLVIVEAMTLGVPVFALENSNTNNLIKNNYNGYIVENNDEKLYEGLKFLINNQKTIEKFKKNLDNYKYENQKIIENIEDLFNN